MKQKEKGRTGHASGAIVRERTINALADAQIRGMGHRMNETRSAVERRHGHKRGGGNKSRGWDVQLLADCGKQENRLLVGVHLCEGKAAHQVDSVLRAILAHAARYSTRYQWNAAGNEA